VARQLVHPVAGEAGPVVVRNGFFSYRWSEILDFMGGGTTDHTVLMAEGVGSGPLLQYKPMDARAIAERIVDLRPPVVFMPHVETSTGILLDDGDIKVISAAAREVGALVVLDCIASGCVWVDMKECGVDVLISAPQKGWSGPAGTGLVMLSAEAKKRIDEGPQSTSFALDLKKWGGIMKAYEGGGFGYHCTMPTDSIRVFNAVAEESKLIGMANLKASQLDLGVKFRRMLESKGLRSCAAPECAAPGVLVYYSPEGVDNVAMVKKFLGQDIQIAAGVPWKLGEPDGQKTFRVGLFGLDKLEDVDACVDKFEKGLDEILKGI